MKKLFPYLFMTMLIFSFSILISRSFRVTQLPNGNVGSCANCHINEGGGGTRNTFGKTVESSFLSSPGSSGNVVWGPDLAAIDSDGDGFTNGEELQDPNGTWIQGQPAPGNASLVTNPGNANSKPDPTSVFENSVIPGQFVLLNNYPNPFNPSTNIIFNIAEVSRVKIEIYNLLGQNVKVLVNKIFAPGTFTETWSALDNSGNKVNSGIYIYRMTAVTELTGKMFSDSKRMVLVK